LWPVYDTALLHTRPTRRPAEVVAFLSLDERSATDLYKRAPADLAQGAADRIVSELDGWQVLGEWSELIVLDRLGPYERRVSAVTYGLEPPIETDGQTLIRPFPASHYRRLLPGTEQEGRTVLRPQLTSIASPSSWLALDPEVAALLGLTAHPDTPLDWRLGEEAAIRTIWWRSGYDRWDPYSENDEVGHGWLVLASPDIMTRLGEHGRLLRVLNVWSGRRGDGDTPEGEEHTEKVVEL
jgi:hypothetical protein